MLEMASLNDVCLDFGVKLCLTLRTFGLNHRRLLNNDNEVFSMSTSSVTGYALWAVLGV